ncbi:MAG: helix-turn-helix transcriptional regulator [Hydrogenophilales bacterium]|nr:helix-turn-helix transcriptional regulator [Hydrogenophilales bacterium]
MTKGSKAIASLPSEAHTALRLLGQRLRAHRLAANWTIEQTAERVLCSPTTYRALEAGKPSVSLGLMVSALWVFGRLDDLGQVFPLGEWLIEHRRARRAGGTSAG